MRQLLWASIVLLLSGSPAMADFVMLADFEDQTFGSVINNPGVSGGSTAPPVNSIVGPGLSGSSFALESVVSDGGTYDFVLDINASTISDIDLANPIIRFDIAFDGVPGDYNQLRLVANNDNPGTGNYEIIDTSAALTSATQTFDLDLTSQLPAIFGTGGTYSTVRFVTNKSATTSGTYTIDNIQYNQAASAIPEPSALAGLAAIGGVVVSRRRRRS